MIEQADLIILVGTRTNQNGTDSWRLIPPGTRVIHIDVLALDEAFAAERPWLIEVITDPDAHPPISLYDGTLDREICEAAISGI